MKKRVFSILLCVMMIMAMLPRIPVMARTPLTHLDLKGFELPTVGNWPAGIRYDEASLNGKTLFNQGVKVSEIIFWDLAPGTVQMDMWEEFKPDNPYKMTVKLQANLQETDLFAAPEQMTATINGLPAKVYRGNYPYERIIEVTYENLMEIDGVYKKAGEKYNKQEILDSIEIANPTNIEVYAVDFRNKKTNIFIAENEYFDNGQEYLARIYIRPTSGTLPEPKAIIPVVDGIQGEVFGVSGQPESRSINVTFHSGAPRKVSGIYLNGVPEPKAGSTVDLNVEKYKIDEFDGKIQKVVWFDYTSGVAKSMQPGDTFKPGHIYMLSLTIEAHRGMEYENANQMNAKINGNTAKVNEVLGAKHPKRIRNISYTFPKLPGDDPDIAQPDTVINNLEITTFMEPKVGEASISEMAISDPHKFESGTHDWLDGDTKERLQGKPFEAGKTYIFRFEGQLKEGYVLAANPVIKINYKQPTDVVVENGGKRLRVEMRFPALAQTTTEINSVFVNGTERPVIGKVPSKSLTELTVGSYNYYIDKVEWRDNTNNQNRNMAAGEAFQSDRNYRVVYFLAPRDGYKFAKDTAMTGRVNGESAKVSVSSGNPNYRELIFDFATLYEPSQPTQPSQPTSFLDVKPSDWFYPNVQYVVSKKIMNGIGNNMFDPNGKMTRSMIVTMVYRIAGSPSVSSKPDYSDNMSGQWFTNAVRWTKQKKLADDFLTSQFEPMANLTREQMITILYQYAKMTNKSLTQKGSLSEFGDAGQLESYSQTPMKWAVYQGIIKGTGGNLLNPKGNISRAEVAAIIQRFNELR